MTSSGRGTRRVSTIWLFTSPRFLRICTLLYILLPVVGFIIDRSEDPSNMGSTDLNLLSNNDEIQQCRFLGAGAVKFFK